MRRSILASLVTALLVEALGGSFLTAADGTLKVIIREAIANQAGKDDFFGPPQDFYAVGGIDFGPPHFTPVKDQRDYASWVPGEIITKVVPGMNQRYFDLYFELWDADPHDFGNVDDGFDISPQDGPPGPPAPGGVYVPNIVTGSNPHVDYDVCTGEMLVKGVNGSPWKLVGYDHADLKGIGTSPGLPHNWGTLRISVVPDPPNWLPEDIKVSEVQIVQSVYLQNRAVADKETILRVTVHSTYPGLILAPITGQLDDGITSVQDSMPVWIEPGENVYYMFDGSRVPPFRPYKPTVIPGPGTGVVHGWARVDYTETISPNAPLELRDCANINNFRKATDLPIVRTSDLNTVYSPFDYDEDMSFIGPGQLVTMWDRDEKLRLASWPLAAVNSNVSQKQLHRNHGSDILCAFEPFCTVIKYSIGAGAAGIDRLVLSVRNGWFADNAFRHQFIGNGSIGYSLGWFARHAVIAENGYYGVAVHELGHTYDLSQHKCSNGGPLDECADEYTHPASDGAPYPARGFDVHGDVYPMGNHEDPNDWRPSLDCPGTPPSGRDICAPNIMDLNCSTRYCNWIDSLSFHWLMDALPHADPFVVNVSGLVRLPAGFGDGTAPPPVEGMMPYFSYQHVGNEDMPEAPLSEMGEVFSGFGKFWIRLVTPGGVRDYRFTPRFLGNAPAPDVAGAFSLDLPWDPATTAIQLIGLNDLRNDGCENVLCPGEWMVLAERLVTPRPPAISGLRAGLDAAPPPGSPAVVPTIGPGHDAVLAWDTSDPDSSDVHALILVMRQDPAGGPPGTPAPVAIDLADNTLRIPHDRLMDEPGSYLVRVFASDGVNTVQADQAGTGGAPLFNICNYTNGGVEICNGIDDDCDGIVDNAADPGPIVDVTLNPQPFPPAPSQGIQWSPDPLAQTYDVLFGELGMLTASGGDFAQAVLACLAEDTPDTTVDGGPDPGPGQAFFYLVRGGNCAGPGTWDDEDPGTPERDPGITASPAACLP